MPGEDLFVGAINGTPWWATTSSMPSLTAWSG